MAVNLFQYFGFKVKGNLITTELDRNKPEYPYNQCKIKTKLKQKFMACLS